jgi:hypothetical protein
VYLLVFTPWTFAAYAFLMIALFLGCLDEAHPWVQWTAYVPVTATTYVLTMGVMFLIYPFTNSFNAMGFIPYVVTIVVIVAGLWLFKRWHSTCICDFYAERRITFIKILALIVLMFALITGYTLVFREVPSGAQKAMSAAFAFIMLFIKKAGLTVTDPIQIELAMLISGFFLQNTFDTFFVCVYPNVEDPQSTFLIVFFASACVDFIYFGFLTDWWFWLRVRIKGSLKAFFCCQRYEREANRGVDDDLDRDDRGQSQLKPGYQRRQVQFFFYRLLSNFIAQIFYLIATPVLRYWNNQDYFPFTEGTTRGFSESELDSEAYRNSIIFAACKALWDVFAFVVGFFVIRWLVPVVFKDLRKKYHNLLVAPLFFGFILATTISTQLLAIWLLLLHNHIWFLESD